MSTSMEDIISQNETTKKRPNSGVSESSLGISSLTLEQSETSLSESGVARTHNSLTLEQYKTHLLRKTDAELKADLEALTLEQYKSLLLQKTDTELMIDFEAFKKNQSPSESTTDNKTCNISEPSEGKVEQENASVPKRRKRGSTKSKKSTSGTKKLCYAAGDSTIERGKKIDRLIQMIENQPRPPAHMCKALNGNIKQSQIICLDWQDKKFTNKTITALSEGLKENNTLINLNLSNTRLNDAGIKKIVDALIKNTTLEQLDISHNNITDIGATYLENLIKQNKALKFLHLEKNKISLHGFKTLKSAYDESTLKHLFLIEGEEMDEIHDIVQSTISKNKKSETKEKEEEENKKTLFDTITTEIKQIIHEINQKMSMHSDIVHHKGLIQDYREIRIIEYPELGHGGFGVVYKGYFRQSPVAVKMVHDNATLTQKQTMKAEVRLMPMLDHDNIVKCRGYYEVPRLSIVMEYTPLGSMKNCLKQTTLNLWQHSHIALNIAHGLRYMHEYDLNEIDRFGDARKGILHRDLNASNVLIFVKHERQLCAKLNDFGLSTVADLVSLSSENHAKAGTGNHKAPEIRTGKRASFEADIYSYGTILFEWLYYPAPVPTLVNEANLPNDMQAGIAPCSSMLKGLMIESCKEEPGQRIKLADIIEKLEQTSQKEDSNSSLTASEPSKGLMFQHPLPQQKPNNPGSSMANPIGNVAPAQRVTEWRSGNSLAASTS